MADAVAVVGAGITGLACADALRGVADVTIVDRVPVAGGVHGWEADETRELVEHCGATMLLGETAIRWDGAELLVIGQDGPRRVAAAALVIATGTRPLGRAELGITGPRPAGVVAATVASHLAENGLLVGRRPVVVGGGDWARRAVEALLEAGAVLVTVIPHGPVASELLGRPGVRVFDDGRVAALDGDPRISAVTLTSGDEVACDALVLAHGAVALRNVDGAVREGRRTVYAQPLADPATVSGAIAAGIVAAEAVRSIIVEEG
jgi:thioredoxin reductase